MRIGEAGTEGTADACDLEPGEYAQAQPPLSMTRWWYWAASRKRSEDSAPLHLGITAEEMLVSHLLQPRLGPL